MQYAPASAVHGDPLQPPTYLNTTKVYKFSFLQFATLGNFSYTLPKELQTVLAVGTI